MNHLRIMRWAVMFSFGFLASAAQAGVYFEPFLGYQTAQLAFKIKDTVPLIGGYEDKGTANGPGAGLGLGYIFDGKLKFLIGAEAIYSKLDIQYEKPTTASAEWTQLTSYVVFGYVPQKNARVYVGLGSLSSESDATPVSKTTGTSAKFGGSYMFYPYLTMNADYFLNTLVESESNGTTTKFEDQYENFSYKGVIINFKLTLGGATK